MIRKKLVALGLVGMTVMGVTAINTKVVKAYTNYNVSENNKENIQEFVKETNELLKEVEYAIHNKDKEEAKLLMSNLNYYIKKLKSFGEVTEAIKHDLSVIRTKYQNVLNSYNELVNKDNLTKIEKMKKEIMNNLNKVNEHLNIEMFIEAGILIDEVNNKITDLSLVASVPVEIANEFQYTINRYEDLLLRKNMAKRLKNEIISILNDIENELNSKHYDGIDGRLRYISSRIDNLEYFAPVDEAIINKYNELTERFINKDKVEPVNPEVNPVETEEDNKEVEEVDSVDLSKSDEKNEEVKKDKDSTEDKEIEHKEEIKSEDKQEIKAEDKQDVKAKEKRDSKTKDKQEVKKDVQVQKIEVKKELANDKEVTNKQVILPKTGYPVGIEMVLGLGATLSALGALTLKKFKK